jgi:hypothetical protein
MHCYSTKERGCVWGAVHFFAQMSFLFIIDGGTHPLALLPRVMLSEAKHDSAGYDSFAAQMSVSRAGRCG